MNKLFKPKTMRRILLFLALIFPVVYLCGGLFFALNGAHGNELFAEPVYTEQYVEVDSTTENGEYMYHIDTLSGSTDVFSVNYPFTLNGNNYSNISFFLSSSGSQKILSVYSPYANLAYVPVDGSISYSADFYFSGNWSFVNYFDGVLYKKVSVPTDVVPENNSAFTVFLFNQPFVKSNFVSAIGRDVLQGTADGFAPMNDLFISVNDNVLHFDESDSLAVFGFGYLYYAVNVIVIYEVVSIALKLLLLPLKVVDKLEVEKDA